MSRVLVLGGSRSGKSAHAEQLLADWAEVTYLATSVVDEADAEWSARVATHRARRPAGWTTVETTAPSELLRSGAVLVDSVTTWVAALMDQTGIWDAVDATGAHAAGSPTDAAAARDRLARRCDALVDSWVMTSAHVVAVSDEVGLGVVPETRAGRLFRDTLGTVNQRLAATADEVWFVVAGLPQRLR
ncbi:MULTISPECIES: bifunctional adenosylcobinamide kinase/adenosylcobinamide-phosphate guanylyltransferase [unclassified Modestobacter]|uniref:bifunctional adenosylcobinamide kinase/adenosylcobinamide-phosphate guanylyltransferase n=1 Tax=unclassified Modestobacter TaxID=2643866 RepID=UPI0022AA55AE|nr:MULTISPECIES: bifunctional adenosylcobinamide kinase/adenosylcobinamide-phosphate guanylyltransferase [unclassified Modestobacter]MCZ2825373.1 bifunctional adenosylcobinamide kinase/adenosylcobinamide-phosphate guanylyltransferase [Modestobacter sp. VKM Ac-2981]MCZ2853562.1 bifunctional adenosylcobinamide kinase/adenosylcobinamide-phosphate guanylyltransferase [Modestobacter sp. VKM Ac-2982]